MSVAETTKTKALGGGVSTSWGLTLPSARVLDRVEQVALLALNAFLVWRLLPADLGTAPLHLLMIIGSELTVLLFVLVRRPTDQISVSPVEWGIAFTGSLAALLVSDTSQPFMPEVGTVLMLVGWVIHFSAKLTLRRSFGVVAANRGLKTDGLYALVRHPMYMGYLITHMGFLLAVPSVWNAVVYLVAWICLVMRMRTEERVLSMSPVYQAYRERVRYRMIPGVW